jgi:hypothetical protein
MHKTIGIISIFILVACASGDKYRPIPKNDLVPLLIDLHVTDAIALNATLTDYFGRPDSSLLYSTLLKKHGYSKDELIYTFEYYSEKPEVLMEVYDEVFASLSRMSEEAKEEYNNYLPPHTTEIWRTEQNRVLVKGNEKQYPGIIDITIDSTGTYVLNMNVKLGDQDEAINPRVIAYFYDPQDDRPEKRVFFDEIELKKSSYTRDFLLRRTIEDISLTGLRLILPQADNTDTLFFKDLDVYNLRVCRVKPEQANPEKE